MLGAVVRPSAHSLPAGLRDLLRVATHSSCSHPSTGANTFPVAAEAGRSALHLEVPQPRTAAIGESAATPPLPWERHHGNGKQTLGRQAGGPKLRQHSAIRAQGVGAPPRNSAVPGSSARDETPRHHFRRVVVFIIVDRNLVLRIN